MADPELDNLFRDLLASNRGPGYGLSVIGVAADRSVIDVELRLIAGRTYCCAEPGCHVPFDKAQQRLHRLATERARPLPDALTVRWHFEIEEGAKFECHRSLGIPLESKAYAFVVAYGETAAE